MKTTSRYFGVLHIQYSDLTHTGEAFVQRIMWNAWYWSSACTQYKRLKTNGLPWLGDHYVEWGISTFFIDIYLEFKIRQNWLNAV